MRSMKDDLPFRPSQARLVFVCAIGSARRSPSLVQRPSSNVALCNSKGRYGFGQSGLLEQLVLHTSSHEQ